ncbi:hypothetical protein U0070_001036 [Myodes glareolus]|uniref:Uncharacterized protein n=1 Tax=Myodes glareolus TaxID=447135 RepID=A0AAW0IEK6_MYOGA
MRWLGAQCAARKIGIWTRAGVTAGHCRQRFRDQSFVTFWVPLGHTQYGGSTRSIRAPEEVRIEGRRK